MWDAASAGSGRRVPGAPGQRLASAGSSRAGRRGARGALCCHQAWGKISGPTRAVLLPEGWDRSHPHLPARQRALKRDKRGFTSSRRLQRKRSSLLQKRQRCGELQSEYCTGSKY